jgi:hypothetical protein
MELRKTNQTANWIKEEGQVPSVVAISAINVLFSDRPKCLDLIFIYFSGLMISIENLRLLKHSSVADRLTNQDLT